MRYTFFVLSIMLPAFLSAQITFTIKGHIADWKGQDSIRLNYVIDNQPVVDSTIAIDGRFIITKTISQPTEAYLGAIKDPTRKRDNIRLFLENGTIYVTGKDSINKSTVKGNGLNEDYQTLNAGTKGILNRLVELRMQAMKTTKEEQALPAFKELEKEYYALIDSMERVKTAFIQKHPKSFISLETIKNMAGPAMKYEKIAPLYNSLSADLHKSPLGVELGKKLAIAKATGIGVKLASFTSYDTAHNTLTLEDVVKTGKVTMIDFWASWCKPCRAENPNVVKAYDAFHAKGFNIISVSLDKTAESWKAAIIKDGMPWYHVSSLQYWKEPVALQYGIEAVPDNLLIDAEGKVIARGLRGEALYKKLESLLN